jgi:hypothetical protein
LFSQDYFPFEKFLGKDAHHYKTRISKPVKPTLFRSFSSIILGAGTEFGVSGIGHGGCCNVLILAASALRVLLLVKQLDLNFPRFQGSFPAFKL